jgi:hypothetical protein
VFEVAQDAGIIYSNPAEKLERFPVRAKQLTLPSGDQFLQIVDAIAFGVKHYACRSNDSQNSPGRLWGTIGPRLRDAG